MGRGGAVGDNPVVAVEEAPGPQQTPSGDARGRSARGGGLVALSEVVALVSAGALVGGGAGMLVGAALGANNPYALGLFGVSAGAVATVLPKVAVGGLGAARRPRWRGRLGG